MCFIAFFNIFFSRKWVQLADMILWFSILYNYVLLVISLQSGSKLRFTFFQMSVYQPFLSLIKVEICAKTFIFFSDDRSEPELCCTLRRKGVGGRAIGNTYTSLTKNSIFWISNFHFNVSKTRKVWKYSPIILWRLKSVLPIYVLDFENINRSFQHKETLLMVVTMHL